MQHLMNDRPRADRVPPARRIRRVATGLALLGFTGLLVPQAIADPTGSASFQEAADGRPDAMFWSGLLLLASALLTFPAIGGILHQARDRGALVANIGAVVAGLGALGHAAMGSISLVLRSLAGGEVTAMRAVENRFLADIPVGIVGLTLLMSFGIGIALLSWAAWRAGIVGLWGPVVVTVVVAAHVLLPEDLPGVVPVAALVLITVVFGWLGVRTLRLSDAAWEARAEAPSAAAGTVRP